MATLEDLFLSSERISGAKDTPPVNPFIDEDALLEAQIVEVLHDGIRSSLGIILEMRLADRIVVASTALIVASGVTAYSWTQVDRKSERTAWTIIGSTPRSTETHINLELTTSPSASLSFTSRQAAFYSVRISELENAAPPDYVDDDIFSIRNGIARWNSKADVVQAIHFG